MGIWSRRTIGSVAAGGRPLKPLVRARIVGSSCRQSHRHSFGRGLLWHTCLQVVALDNGAFAGAIQIPDTLEPGNYVLRALTDLQKQIGEDAFFYKQIQIYLHRKLV